MDHHVDLVGAQDYINFRNFLLKLSHNNFRSKVVSPPTRLTPCSSLPIKALSRLLSW